MAGYQYAGTVNPRVRRPVKPCGTDAAYKRHLVKGEVACQPCLDAHAAKYREWYRKGKNDGKQDA